MATRKIGKIWIGIGAAALLGSGVNPPTDAAEPAGKQLSPLQQQGAAPTASDTHINHVQSTPVNKPAQGGEGGEGGEGSSAGLDPRVKFFRDMSLVRGHLFVGDELIKAGLWDDALPHFHHPVEELYASIGPKLKGQGLPQFDMALKALAQTVQARNARAYANALKVVERRMDEADLGMRKFAVPFVLSRVSTIVAVLQSAAGEYAEAIENGKIGKPVEYQDSRGFVFYAERMLDSISKDLEKIDKAALAATRAAFAELKTAWPAPVPPSTPVKDHGAVLADVSRVGLAVSPFLKK